MFRYYYIVKLGGLFPLLLLLGEELVSDLMIPLSFFSPLSYHFCKAFSSIYMLYS